MPKPLCKLLWLSLSGPVPRWLVHHRGRERQKKEAKRSRHKTASDFLAICSSSLRPRSPKRQKEPRGKKSKSTKPANCLILMTHNKPLDEAAQASWIGSNQTLTWMILIFRMHRRGARGEKAKETSFWIRSNVSGVKMDGEAARRTFYFRSQLRFAKWW